MNAVLKHKSYCSKVKAQGVNVFKIGDLIVYGNAGVCKVEEIGTPDLKSVTDDKDYYTLTPYYSNRSRIFTPCDNDRVIMRAVISPEEAGSIVDSIPESDVVEVLEEKRREDVYKGVMKECDCRRFVSLLKTIYIRKEKRLSEGKKVTASDEKYYNMAYERLCDELAVAMSVEREEVCRAVDEKISLSV